MAQRNRRRQRGRGGARGKLLFVGAGLLVAVALAAVAVASWVLDVAAQAPSLAACKKVGRSGNTVVYAADGSKLGLVDSDEAREPVAIGRVPKQLQLATVAIEDQRFYEHGGIDLEGILRAEVKNLEAGQDGRGRLDDHPAAGPQPLHPQPEADPRTQDHRGEAGDRVRPAPLKAGNPWPVSQRRLLRDGRRRHRGRRRRRLEDLLLQAGLEAEPGAGGAAGRAAAGPLRIQPDPQPGPGSPTAQRGAGEDGGARLSSHPRGSGARRDRDSASTPPAPTSPTASPTSSTTSKTS